MKNYKIQITLFIFHFSFSYRFLYTINKLGDCLLHVYIGLHCLVVAVPREFHNNLRRDPFCKRVANEGPAGGVCAHKFPFRAGFLYALAAFVVYFCYWLIEAAQLAQVL